jgi:hypothetical protein
MRTLFLIIFIFPQFLMAEVVVRSPFFFPVNPSDYKKVLENYDPVKDLAQTAHIDHIKITEPYKTDISGVNFVFDATSHLIPENETGQFSFTIDVAKVSASIDKIVTDDSIQHSVGGAVISAFLQGSCSGVNLQSTASSLKVSGRMGVQSHSGRLKMDISSFEIQGDSAWTIDTQSCAGPAGYQAVLEKAILDLMKDNGSLKDLLRQGLDSALLTMSSQLNAQVLKVMTTQVMEGVELVLIPSAVDIDGSTGWLLIQGEVSTKIASDRNADVVVDAVLDASDSGFVASSGLLLSQDFIQAVIKNLHQEEMVKYAFNGADIPSFKSFLGNRFFQWFLWPDLLNFAKNTAFKFLAKAKSVPVVTLAASEKGSVFYNIKDLVSIDMNAPQGNSYIPYMNFQSNIDVNSWMTVSKGKMHVGLYQPKMDLKAAWDKSYLKKYHPSTYFSSIFAGQVAKGIKGAQKSLNLPELNLNTVTMTADRFDASKKWLQLIYKAH